MQAGSCQQEEPQAIHTDCYQVPLTLHGRIMLEITKVVF